jgi:hypothetical protein
MRDRAPNSIQQRIADHQSFRVAAGKWYSTSTRASLIDQGTGDTIRVTQTLDMMLFQHVACVADNPIAECQSADQFVRSSGCLE